MEQLFHDVSFIFPVTLVHESKVRNRIHIYVENKNPFEVDTSMIFDSMIIKDAKEGHMSEVFLTINVDWNGWDTYKLLGDSTTIVGPKAVEF